MAQITFADDIGFIAFIDEAGDTTLTRVRPIDEIGGTEWMVVSAVVVSQQKFHLVDGWHEALLSKLEITQTRHIHFKNLNERQRTDACSFIADLPVRLFAVVSNKRTLRAHHNERAGVRGGKQWYYNWMIRLLLERVTHYCTRKSKSSECNRKLHVVFAKTGMHSYSQTAAYHELLNYQSNADNVFLDKMTPDYSVLERRNISNFLAKNVSGLQLSDIIASAFYAAVDNLDTGPCRPEFAKLLGPRVAGRPSGSQMDYGVLLQPTKAHPICLPPDQREIFEFFGYGFYEDGSLL